MIINIKSKFSVEKIEYILSSQQLENYPKSSCQYNLGINWVSNKRNFLCLFYEDGAKDRFNCSFNAKPFFYGKVIKHKDDYRIVGIACLNIVHIILLFVALLISIFTSDEFIQFDNGTLFALIFVSFLISIFVSDFFDGIKEIKKYLLNKFG